MILCPISIRISKLEKPFKLSEKTQIRELSKNELKQYFGIDLISYDHDNNRTGISYSLERASSNIWSSIPKSILVDEVLGDDNLWPPDYAIESSDNEEIKTLIIARHIITRGNFVCPLGIEFLDETKIIQHFYHPFNFSLEQPCKLSIDDLEESQKLFLRIMEKESNGKSVRKNSKKDSDNFEVLFKRLLRCCDIDQCPELRMIDAVSLIESIVCTGSTTELCFRFALYYSFLLNKAGIQVSFSEMTKFYNTRSNLAHSGHDKNLKLDDTKWKEEIDKIMSYMKVILKEHINNYVDGETIKGEILSKLEIELKEGV